MTQQVSNSFRLDNWKEVMDPNPSSVVISGFNSFAVNILNEDICVNSVDSASDQNVLQAGTRSSILVPNEWFT